MLIQDALNIIKHTFLMENHTESFVDLGQGECTRTCIIFLVISLGYFENDYVLNNTLAAHL